MEDDKISSEELVQKYWDRIGEIDTHGPELKSVIELNPDALMIAKVTAIAMTAFFATGQRCVQADCALKGHRPVWRVSCAARPKGSVQSVSLMGTALPAQDV